MTAAVRKNPAAVALGRMGGLKGGKARAASLTAEERQQSARAAAVARWGTDEARQERAAALANRKAARDVRRAALLLKRPEKVAASNERALDQVREEFELSQRVTSPGVAPKRTQGGTREQIRSRRKRDVRGKTISVKRMTKRDLEFGKLLYPDTGHKKPQTREQCEGGYRPCPYVSCKYNLYLDASPKSGAIKLNFPDLEPDQLTESCVLDLAARGPQTLERVAELLNFTRERTRQIDVKILVKLRRHKGELPLPGDFEHPIGERSTAGAWELDDPESQPGRTAADQAEKQNLTKLIQGAAKASRARK